MTGAVDNKKLAILASAGVGLSLTALAAHYLLKRYRYWNRPFVKAGKVEQLFVFPIKSCKGIETDYIDCNVRGSSVDGAEDRSFLIVDARTDHNFLTARTYPRMVLIESHVKDDVFTVSAPGTESIKIDLKQVVERNDVRRAKLHRGEKTDGLDCGDEVGTFLTKFLDVVDKRELRLLYFRDGLHTQRDFRSLPEYWHNTVPDLHDHIAYADLAAYMACTTASVDDLNKELKDEKAIISVRNFRPNILVSGVPAWDEDKWLHVRIGETEFVCYKPCTRCILTTVDPDAGVKHPGMQPLKKLREFRLAPEGKLRQLYGDSPVFGVNMAIGKPGRIRVGDDVYIRYKPTPY